LRERLQSWLNMMNERWKELTKSQKIKVSAIAGVVLVALILTLVLTLRTNWEPAITTADGASAITIANVLNDEGIRTRTDSTQGVVYVPARDVDRAWLTAQTSPTLHAPGFNFERAIETSGMGVTRGMEHNMIIRARETEITQALMSFSAITGAVVLVNQPNTSMILAPTVPATASVQLEGTNLTPEMGQTAALITSRSVAGLTVDNVTVTDITSMHVLFNNGEMQGRHVGGGSTIQATNVAINHMAENNTRNVLGGMFPRLDISATAVVDWTEIFRETWNFINPVEGAEGYYAHRGLLSEESFQDIAAFTRDRGLGVEPGVMPNDFPGGPLFADDFGDSILEMFDNSAVRRFVYDTIHTIETSEPGRLVADESRIAIVAHRESHFYRERMITMEQLDDTQMAWYLFQEEMGTEPFLDTTLDEAEYEFLISLVQNATGFENVTLGVFVTNVFHDIEPPAPLPITTIVLLALIIVFIALLAFGLIRRTQPVPIEDIEPELSVEDLLVSSQLVDAQEAEMARLEAIKHSQDSQVKEQIDKFVEEKPEAVAQLLRNWINDDWE